MPQTPASPPVSLGPASSIPSVVNVKDSLTRYPACANAHTALGLLVPCSPWGQLIARHSSCSINTCVGPSFPADTTAVLSLLVKQTLNAAHQSHLVENWTGPPGRLAGGLRSRRLLSPCCVPGTVLGTLGARERHPRFTSRNPPSNGEIGRAHV